MYRMVLVGTESTTRCTMLCGYNVTLYIYTIAPSNVKRTIRKLMLVNRQRLISLEISKVSICNAIRWMKYVFMKLRWDITLNHFGWYAKFNSIKLKWFIGNFYLLPWFILSGIYALKWINRIKREYDHQVKQSRCLLQIIRAQKII